MKLALSRSEELKRLDEWKFWEPKTHYYYVHAKLELTPEEQELFEKHKLNVFPWHYDPERETRVDLLLGHISFVSLIEGRQIQGFSIDDTVLTEQAIIKACEALKSRFEALRQPPLERIIDI